MIVKLEPDTVTKNGGQMTFTLGYNIQHIGSTWSQERHVIREHLVHLEL